MNKLNPSIKHHTYVGLFVGFWIYFFTFYIRPFNGPSFSDSLWWEFLSIGFSLITFLSYFISTLFQDSIYQQFFKWNIFFEILIILLFLFLNLIFTYLYYKSPFLNGILTFSEFSNATFKSAIIFTPILVFSRRFTIKFLPKEKKKKENEILTIKGDYKLDILKILKSDLVCISKSQNYIEVFFIENGILKSKLMRSSLKKIQKELFFLIQVHRSHLINPQHFKSWKNQNIVLLTQIEIPVSKNYKKNISTL
ncbi:LytTR family DNA-binding domain-containing protein [uncultured Tenacibaculum sp.]|uniref:LytTR family DNA-binding domain-containing protein n=1 Tax=uncultured Tenacibaculum sp. TaxID=174713 RepID=UPI00261F6CD9|nr:LytTR family DNA-binding domain-containing protein [uncultured Tenacibaculum sp.]